MGEYTEKKSMPIWHGDYAKTALPDSGSVWHIDNAVLALFSKEKTKTLEKRNILNYDVM